MQTLAAVVPEITNLEPIDTEGFIYSYQLPWDGESAHVWILAPDYTDNQTLRHTFDEAIADWAMLADRESVTTVHETDTDPATWVVFNASDNRLSDCHENLTLNQSLAVIASIGKALEVARRQDIYLHAARESRPSREGRVFRHCVGTEDRTGRE